MDGCEAFARRVGRRGSGPAGSRRGRRRRPGPRLPRPHTRCRFPQGNATQGSRFAGLTPGVGQEPVVALPAPVGLAAGLALRLDGLATFAGLLPLDQSGLGEDEAFLSGRHAATLVANDVLRDRRAEAARLKAQGAEANADKRTGEILGAWRQDVFTIMRSRKGKPSAEYPKGKPALSQRAYEAFRAHEMDILLAAGASGGDRRPDFIHATTEGAPGQNITQEAIDAATRVRKTLQHLCPAPKAPPRKSARLARPAPSPKRQTPRAGL